MSRLQDNPYLPVGRGDAELVRQMDRLYREIATQLNQLSEGSIVAAYNAATAPPTAGTYQRGDFIRNSAPGVLGAPGSQYVLIGWVCVAAGTPGTWVQSRTLTGT